MSSSPEESDDYDQLCAALGHLILGFSNLEQSLSIALKWHLSDAMLIAKQDLSLTLASAIYGSMRFKAARDTIKRILAAEDAPPQLNAFLANVFAHAGHLEELRDKLAHQALFPPSDTSSGGWEVRDVFTTRDAQNDKAWSINVDAIECAAHDVHELVLRISAYLDERKALAPLFKGLNLEPLAWRYKPSMLALLPRSKRNAPQGQPHQQLPSEE